jgi:hypothetical protein
MVETRHGIGCDNLGLDAIDPFAKRGAAMIETATSPRIMMSVKITRNNKAMAIFSENFEIIY